MRIEKGFIRWMVIGVAVLICMVGCSLGLAHAGSTITDNFFVLHNFAGYPNDAAGPYGDLTLVWSTLYGMTWKGGAGNSGTIFRINTDGSGYQILHSFSGSTLLIDGANPTGDLTLVGSTLYGMTSGGGANGVGTIFKINIDGTGYQMLYSFQGGTTDGANPNGSLTLSGTTLYGMTLYGGANDTGTIFKINTDGSGCELLYSFLGPYTDGAFPIGSLTLVGSTLYGMTSNGGASDHGTIFQISTSDSLNYQMLYSFQGGTTDGANPAGSLTLTGSTLYGMTAYGGASGAGTIFQINTSSPYQEQVLYSFGGVTNDGTNPSGSLMLSGSTLYGVTPFGGAGYGYGTIFQINTSGAGYQVMYCFGNGANPYGSLTLLGSTLYGMTYLGGAGGNGTIFSINDTPAVPDAPTGVMAAAGSGQAAVSFTAPNGSPPINSYTVTSSPGGITATGAGSPIIVPGLTDGAAYTFTVTATNTVGTGPPSSASNSVTPYVDSSPPQSIAVLAGTWNFNTFASGPVAPWWERGTVSVNPDGTFTFDSTPQTNNGSANPGNGPFAFWSSPGGYFFTNGKEPNNILCQIDYGNTVLACTQTWSDYSTSLMIFTKQAASYSLTDLTDRTGAWEGNFLTTTGPRTGAAQTDSITVTSNGNNATWTDLTASTTGTWSISSSTGVITDPLDTTFSGVMGADKTVIVATSGASPALLKVYAQQAASYLPADLTGTWQGNLLTTTGWARDTLTVNQDGTFTISETASDGSAQNLTGTVTLSSEGAVTFIVDTETSVLSIYGDMAADKTVMVTTQPNGSIEIFTKNTALTVTISPNDAVSAGAMWNVDGGSWQASGATVFNLSAGSHTVAFNEIYDWTTPASQTFNISSGQTASLIGTYAQIQSGSLTVTISPAGAVSAGAMWNVDGGSRQASGATVSSLSVGVHTVAFNSITGWTTPSNVTCNISNGQTTSLSGTYVQQTGSLTVTISPAGAVSAGAMWNVDGGSWQGSGTTILGITVGSHTVAFNNIIGWTTPSAQTANISNGQTTSLIGAYAQQTGSLTVTINPAGAVSAGAMWNVDGGTWQASGATVSSLSVGSHTVGFKDAQGWTTPSAQTANITNGQTASLSGAYAQTGSLTVTIGPAGAVAEGAMWNVDGGGWQASGATVSNLCAGSHTVAFNNLQGWTTPSAQTASITSGQTASATGKYTPVFAAIFTAKTTSGKAPLTVHFIDGSVGRIKSRLWNFGDGTTSDSKNPTHTYKAGTYTVTLIVTGAGGTNVCSEPHYITVYAAPKANFSAAPTSGKAPLQVSFTDESTGLITSRLWHFGDGTTSTEESPDHTYSKPGTYNAKLTVTGPGGSSTKTLSIRVTK